jgi:hypothetical protein
MLIALTLSATSLTALPAHQRLNLFGQVLDLYSLPHQLFLRARLCLRQPGQCRLNLFHARLKALYPRLRARLCLRQPAYSSLRARLRLR